MKLHASGVTLAYGAGHAVRDISLDIAPGEQIAFIGPSGAGKTSLLRLMATGAKPSAGSVALDDADPWSLRRARLRALRSTIGLIHQSPPIPPRQRVITAVLAGRLGQWSLPQGIASLLYPRDIDGARHALARLDLGERLFARCDQLSGGQLQRVGIARVLYQQPRLVLADEPVSAMDPVLAAHTLEVLCDDARKRDATLLVSLHAVDLALGHFARVIGLREGSVLFDRKSSDVKRNDLDALYANEQLEAPLAARATPAMRLVPRC